MRNIKVILQYEGTRYQGWQRQDSTDNTIQGKLEDLLGRMCGRKVEVIGSGRTDAGVHAYGQTANFHIETEMELQEIMDASLKTVKQELSGELFDREQKTPGSISLSAGSCLLCKGSCGRKENEPCRFPDQMRYSIESLGGNVGLTLSKLMGIELEWMEEGKLPHYFVLVCGLLR